MSHADDLKKELEGASFDFTGDNLTARDVAAATQGIQLFAHDLFTALGMGMLRSGSKGVEFHAGFLMAQRILEGVMQRNGIRMPRPSGEQVREAVIDGEVVEVTGD